MALILISLLHLVITKSMPYWTRRYFRLY